MSEEKVDVLFEFTRACHQIIDKIEIFIKQKNEGIMQGGIVESIREEASAILTYGSLLAASLPEWREINASHHREGEKE